MKNIGGAIIKELRTKLKWSQFKLSLESGVAVNTIQEIEKGLRGGNLSTFIKLINAMGYDLEVVRIDE